MTDEQLNLARRAVACKHWRWMPGMVTRGGRRFQAEMRSPRWLPGSDPDLALPDLTDAATIGCLVKLVREAWPGCDVTVHWCVLEDGACTGVIEISASDFVDDNDAHFEDWRSGSVAEALVKALESAP